MHEQHPLWIQDRFSRPLVSEASRGAIMGRS